MLLIATANEEAGARHLRSLADELRDIIAALDHAQQASICEVVTLPDATPEQVMGVFQAEAYRDRVAILHFAGHAGPEGLLFETSTGETAVADAGGLAAFLGCQRGLQLVVLNACATQAHVDALRDAGVGAVIATSRTVEDAIAHQFAVLLYQGLGSGAGIKRAYDEAAAGVRFKHGAVARGATAETMHASAAAVTVIESATGSLTAAAGVTRDIVRRKTVTTDDGRWPWDIYFRRGAEESVGPWALPEAAGNPLFGLPPLPETDKPLDAPFRHLRPFAREHAELFFGRGKDIRELYDKVTGGASEPVILMYGATGVGKSSLLDAGLLPRLTGAYEVRYARRDRTLGLLGTLALALGADVTGAIDDARVADAWRRTETEGGRPLFVVVDQLEEAYTSEDAGHGTTGDAAHELDIFAAAIGSLFASDATRPRGRLVLGFRKEWLSEVKGALEAHRVARTEHRLEQLTRGGVLEAITGPTRLPARRMPTRLEIEPGLDVLIADDLLANRASHVAPLLQILLAEMWADAPRRDGVVRFDITLYDTVRAKAKQLDAFLTEQLEALRAWRAPIVESGLALDYLRFYTTPKGSSDERTVDEERIAYPSANDPPPGLRAICARLFLLVERASEKADGSPGDRSARLAHDTLAPLVRERFERSDAPGPRARRILEGRATEWSDGRTGVPLDEQDLGVVEAGERGMRAWTEDEKRLVAASRVARDRARRRRAWVIRGAIAAVTLIAGFGIGSWLLYRQSQDRLAESQSREFAVRALGTTAERRDVGFLYAASGYERGPTFEARRALFSHLAANPRLIRVFPSNASDMMFTADGRSIVLREDAPLGTGDSQVAGRVVSSLHFVDVERGTVVRSVDIGVDSVGAYVRLDRGGRTYSGGLTRRANTSRFAVGVWSIETGQRLGAIPLDSARADFVEWLVSPPTASGATRVAIVVDSAVTLWDLATGRQMHELRGHTAEPRAEAFSPDGALLVTTADDGRVIVWNVESGEVVRSVTIPPDRMPSVAIARDNSALVTVHDDSLVLWPLGDREPRQETPFTGKNLSGVAFASNDSLLAVGGQGGRVHILRAPYSYAMDSLEASGDVAQAMGFSPTGARLAVLAVGGLLHVWDLGPGGFVERAMVSPDVRITAMSDDGRYAIGESADTFTVWDVSTRGPLNRVIVGQDTTPRREVTTVLANGRRRRMTIGGGTRPRFLTAGVGSSGAMIMASPMDRKAVYARVVFDAARGALARSLPPELASPPALDPVGARIAYGLSGSGAVVVEDLRTSRSDTLNASEGEPSGLARLSADVAFSPDGSLLLMQPTADVILVWDFATGRVRDSLATDGMYASRMRVSADGRVVAAVMLDDVVFWRRGNARPIGQLRVSLGGSPTVALSPDGSLFAYESQGTVSLTDVERRENLGALQLPGSVVGLAFVDGGARLLVMHEDGAVERIETDPARWLERVCAIAGSEPARVRWRSDAPEGAPLPSRCAR